jgi:hypothetical protein
MDFYNQGYDAQAAVDGAAQIFVEHGRIEGLIDGIEGSLGQPPPTAAVAARPTSPHCMREASASSCRAASGK